MQMHSLVIHYCQHQPLELVRTRCRSPELPPQRKVVRQANLNNDHGHVDPFAMEQCKDPEYAESGQLPEDARRARRLVSEGSVFALVDGVFCRP